MIAITTPELLYNVRKKILEKEIKMVKYRRWTEQAKDCYKRGCNCNDCPTKKLITSTKCQMKAVLIQLVKDFGLPEDCIKKSSIIELD